MENKLICFDLDGLYFTERSFQKFKEILAPNAKKEERDEVLALSEEMKAFKSGNLTEKEYRDRAQEKLGTTYSIDEISEKFSESYEVNEKVVQLAQRLRSKGYKTGICSNNFPTRIRALEKKFNFLDNFDVHIFSYEVGIAKPDPKIFQILIEKSGIHAEQIIYSDDSEKKLEGAKKLGIQTFIFHDFDEFIQDLKNCGIEI